MADKLGLASAALHCGIVALTVALAAAYGSAREMLPYHRAAVGGVAWGDLEPEWRLLVIAIYQVMASTMLVQALYLASFGVRAATSGNLAACLKLLVIQACHWVPMLVVSLRVQRETPADTPWKFAVLYGALSVTAFGCGLARAVKARNPPSCGEKAHAS